jgi:ABC-type nitrate/sulfonate/bicarbonate transport system substrate-binding protein
MTKLLNIFIVLLSVALVAVILYPQIQDSRPRVLRLACDSTVASLPFIVGIEESLFIHNRIVPELHFYSDPDAALADLFAGNVDVGIFPWSEVMRHAADKGETLRVFMSLEYRVTLPVDAIVVTQQSKIKDIAGLSKRKLGYPPQLRGCIRPFLLQSSLPTELVTTVELPLGELTAQLAAGAIDAAWLIEPLICGLDTTAFRVLQAGALPKYVSAPFPGAAVGFTTEFMNSNKVLLNRLKISADATAAFSEGNADRARQHLGRYLACGTGDCAACRLPELQRLVEINKPAIRTFASRLAVSGVLASDVDTDKMFVEPARMTR